MSKIIVTFLVVISALALTACSGGGGGGPGASFSLTYNAPGGSGFVGGTTDNRPFSPAIQADLILSFGIAINGKHRRHD